MLTKLEAAMAGSPPVATVEVGAEELVAVSRQLDFRVEEFATVTGGTSAVAKLARGSGRSAFLKSYRWDAGRERLGAEVRLLSAAYPGLVGVRLIEPGNGFALPWMAMDELRLPDSPVDPGRAMQLVANYSENLRALYLDGGPQPPSLNGLLDIASQAVDELATQDELDGRMATRLRVALDEVSQTIERAPPVICHGDLSPKNIMQTHDSLLVAVDWEDSVLGFQGYDYLYWLTFMDNRQFYDDRALGVTGLGFDVEKSVMLFVVLLKGYISFLNNTLKRNKVPLMVRLDEINSI